jgi:hypothetical protein
MSPSDIVERFSDNTIANLPMRKTTLQASPPYTAGFTVLNSNFWWNGFRWYGRRSHETGCEISRPIQRTRHLLLLM